jgi:hypothetical protein
MISSAKPHRTSAVPCAQCGLRGQGSALFTNGNGRPVTCRWARDGKNLPTGTVTAASGQQQVRVGLKGNLRGTGTRHAAAIFQFFTPDVISAQSASFTCK